MPASRTFSYEHLQKLILDHPDWSHSEYARALTEEVRIRLSDPKFPMIRPNTVSAVLNRYRDTWFEQGVRVPLRRANRVIPWKGIPKPYDMDTKLRRLRTLEQIDRGKRVSPRDEQLALTFQRTLHERRQVLDLTPLGRPVLRPARPDEVDGTGELLALTARHPGLTQSEWESMTPDQRRTASSKWMANGESSQ